jgi:hypothetical protein
MRGKFCAFEGDGDLIGSPKGTFSGSTFSVRILVPLLGDPLGDLRNNFSGGPP